MKNGLCNHCRAKTPKGWSACERCYNTVQVQFIDFRCTHHPEECPHKVIPRGCWPKPTEVS